MKERKKHVTGFKWERMQSTCLFDRFSIIIIIIISEMQSRVLIDDLAFNPFSRTWRVKIGSCIVNFGLYQDENLWQMRCEYRCLQTRAKTVDTNCDLQMHHISTRPLTNDTTSPKALLLLFKTTQCFNRRNCHMCCQISRENACNSSTSFLVNVFLVKFHFF